MQPPTSPKDRDSICAEERKRMLTAEFDAKRKTPTLAPPREVVGQLLPAIVLAPISILLALTNREGTAMAATFTAVAWMLIVSVRLRERSRIASIAVAGCMLLYMWVMFFLLVVFTLDGQNPIVELLHFIN